MKTMRMPASYAAIPNEELPDIIGGGAVRDFFENVKLNDLFFGHSIIAISFSFVPYLLFQAVKATYEFGKKVYEGTLDLIARIPVPLSGQSEL